MRHLSWAPALIGTLLLASACGESPTEPPADLSDPTPIDPSVITPIILPSGADWGLYFQSFNQTRSLTARAIHYPDGTVTGRGIFTLPTVGSGILRVTGATPYGNCIPQASPCGTVTNVPESAITTGTATFLSGSRAGRSFPFTLDLHSNLWPNPTNTFDTATLTFCYTSSRCHSYSFFGELHHEPQ
jgi:hypothetical protein